MPPNLLALGRLLLYLPLTLICIPIQLTLLKLGAPLSRRFLIFYHGMVCRVFGIRRIVRGTMSKAHPTLFVANHSSYIDIEVVGSIVEGSFVAKQEVATWPFIGMLAKLQRTVFIDRRLRHVGTQRNEMTERIEGGDNLILFPEGTSNDGNRTLPFKSALFSVAEIECDGMPVQVQPVSIAYTHLDGIPLGRQMRPFVAWYGDMELVPHLWTLIGLGRLTARVDFHEPVTIRDFGGRKELAEYCYRVVSGGVAAALYGRQQPQISLNSAA